MSSNDILDDFEVAAAEAAAGASPSSNGSVSLNMEDAASMPLLAGGAGAGADYSSITPSPEKKKKAKDAKKAPKSGQKLVSDALKTDMAAERTFFKWLWTGLHTGAIGTFIFVTFDSDKQDPYRIFVVGFAWTIAFALVLYGLFAYNRRRAALRDGNIDLLPAITREWGPCIVVVALLLVVGSGLLYAVLSGVPPNQGSKHHAFTTLEAAGGASGGALAGSSTVP